MQCRIADLRCREVINIHNGFRLGFVSDVIINIATGQIGAFVVPGPCRFFGLFGREDDYIIPWECITRIGEDIVLIDMAECKRGHREKKSWF
jgi:YlmC/YmxH family sporulation protein